MSFSKRTQDLYLDTLKTIRDQGGYKQERIICDVQGAEIEAEFPAGAPRKKFINMCSNNYLVLPSHPDVIKAAHEALDYRGFGLPLRGLSVSIKIYTPNPRRLVTSAGAGSIASLGATSRVINIK